MGLTGRPFWPVQGRARLNLRPNWAYRALQAFTRVILGLCLPKNTFSYIPELLFFGFSHMQLGGCFLTTSLCFIFLEAL